MKQTLLLLFVIAFITSNAQTKNSGSIFYPQKIEDYKSGNMSVFYGLTDKKVNPNLNKSIEAIGWLENFVAYTKDSTGVYQKSYKIGIYNQSILN